MSITREDILRQRGDGTLRYYPDVAQDRPGYEGYANAMCNSCGKVTSASYGWDDPEGLHGHEDIDICPRCYWAIMHPIVFRTEISFYMNASSGKPMIRVMVSSVRRLVISSEPSYVVVGNNPCQPCRELMICGFTFWEALFFVNFVRWNVTQPMNRVSWSSLLSSRVDPVRALQQHMVNTAMN